MNDFVRFMTKVTVPAKQHQCWMWKGSKSEDGYGFFRVGGRSVKAHRWIYERIVAPIDDGLVLRHSCDTPACVNPLHLVPGTVLQNVRDCITRGRRVNLQGESHSASKLTEADVIQIRRRAACGESCRQISADYPVGKSQIERIVNRTKWSHVA